MSDQMDPSPNCSCTTNVIIQESNLVKQIKKIFISLLYIICNTLIITDGILLQKCSVEIDSAADSWEPCSTHSAETWGTRLSASAPISFSITV